MNTKKFVKTKNVQKFVALMNRLKKLPPGLQERVGTHTMRKTFGYHHYKQNRDVAMLQKIYNHSSPKITLEYIGIIQDEIEESYTNFIL